ncbi:Uma2 family endonuclease [Pyxidicoccus fallax]|uniref:Uma2 family endonuclease n=1 Tax=Pyxidicoccus fallax TaxID=394095 RepID=A0A848LRS4_9BACT|nr:Uma2 family endonuclease [Pyxidicoccus fallax]NMO20625.1 Uma2 family endonuclease [Pyxidicoccus fallax]NPC81468.1 Uma2 family endonuclease [Pyxidicoccus fallax]
MSDKPRTESIYEALERLPPEVVGEIIDGKLHVSPRPAFIHSRAAARLYKGLGPFDEEEGGEGPGGWLMLFKPWRHLGGNILVPDIAGWRRERMPEMPDVTGTELTPDWLCEVLSPSTEALERNQKMAVYAREGVKHLWLVAPRARTLEVYRLQDGDWRKLGEHAGNAEVRAEPFEALPLKLALLWQR